ncbi:OmpA family protein [Pseudonocardia sp. DSM 110487]|uniref:OmpA family protein n=1 Tax=Pseudonocardia sp. DSM 110487 TaxID=2865833 RepID=UPI001C69797B|nr:OmpA family protein [Pseudonocardia sp. DSM 110487]QYN37103.1 OmpA family protein [Pseudonocardia sp. DSM 110487]
MRAAGLGAAALVAAALVAGCTVQVNGGGTPAAATSPLTPAAALPSGSRQTPVAPGAGVTARPQSSALPFEARKVRLARVQDQLALQFEMVNSGTERQSPSMLGIDLVQQLVMLADLPRRTGYSVLAAGPPTADGRISANVDEFLEPGTSATITVMFAPPPEETTTMMVMIAGFLPVEVPVERDADLVDDPVLHSGPPTEDDGSVGPLSCIAGSEGDGKAAATKRVELPSDVLFAFGSATLSPAATGALDELGKQLGGAGSGSIRVEGHTDAVDDDQFNQQLSEQRAAAVRDALAARLGNSYTYGASGAGESRPIAANAKPDGSDDPDGRALNRRVEITIETDAASTAAEADPSGEEDVDPLTGFTAEPRSVRRVPGFALVQVALRNSGGADARLDFASDSYNEWQGELSLVDSTGGRHKPCDFAAPVYFNYVGTLTSAFGDDINETVPAGATVVLWSLFALPAVDSASVDVHVAGLSENVPTPVET